MAATATATAPNGNRQATQDPSALLEEVLKQTPVKRFKIIADGLSADARVEQVAKVLPANMKGQAERFVARAIMTLNRKGDQYKDVTPASFIRCVVEAAELGLAIDGRLAHAVVYSNKIKGPDGKDVWVSEAQLQVDYKGILAVARRIGTVVDCWARLVSENDEFDMHEADGECHYSHRPALGDPGAVIGVLAVIKLPGGVWRYEWMSTEDVNRIRARSKSFQKKGGPWLTDDGEMRKKTVIKRALKLYADDPAIVRLMELDDRDYEETETAAKPEPAELTPGRSRIAGARKTPTPPAAKAQAPVETPPANNDTFTAEDETPPVPAEDPVDQGDAAEISPEAEETILALNDAIDAADAKAALDALRAKLTEARPIVGEHAYEALRTRWRDRYKAIGAAPAK